MEREKCLDGREWVYDEGEFTDVGFVLDCFGGIVLHQGIGKLAGLEGFCFWVGRLETVVEPKERV